MVGAMLYAHQQQHEVRTVYSITLTGYGMDPRGEMRI